ncbi:hypothetical protein LCGC14_3010330 [marine sediment metagenome]|uniref:Uncharacterized protein n=1 Tax=marine sediment metagenome TaxID=412755 RepID=A0A0F8XL69_9ZZZZ
MIQIEDLKARDVGRAVIYRSPGVDKAASGYISSWNYALVFVRYGAGPQAAATDPKDLEWAYGAD